MLPPPRLDAIFTQTPICLLLVEASNDLANGTPHSISFLRNTSGLNDTRGLDKNAADEARRGRYLVTNVIIDSAARIRASSPGKT